MSHQYTHSSFSSSLRRSSIVSEKTLVDTQAAGATEEKLQAKHNGELPSDSHPIILLPFNKSLTTIFSPIDHKSSAETSSTRSRTSTGSLPSIMSKAVKKAKSKLGNKESSSKSKHKPKSDPKPESKRPDYDAYPDTVYMWRALAGKKLARTKAMKQERLS